MEWGHYWIERGFKGTSFYLSSSESHAECALCPYCFEKLLQKGMLNCNIQALHSCCIYVYTYDW